jgi:hypothetical protein
MLDDFVGSVPGSVSDTDGRQGVGVSEVKLFLHRLNRLDESPRVGRATIESLAYGQ